MGISRRRPCQDHNQMMSMTNLFGIHKLTGWSECSTKTSALGRRTVEQLSTPSKVASREVFHHDHHLSASQFAWSMVIEEYCTRIEKDPLFPSPPSGPLVPPHVVHRALRLLPIPRRNCMHAFIISLGTVGPGQRIIPASDASGPSGAGGPTAAIKLHSSLL